MKNDPRPKSPQTAAIDRLRAIQRERSFILAAFPELREPAFDGPQSLARQRPTARTRFFVQRVATKPVVAD